MYQIYEKSSRVSNEARVTAKKLVNGGKHDVVNIQKAFSHFARSIAYAENNTELAMTFNSRSILLYHIQKYDLSLVDIDAALNVTTSSLLKASLLIRKISCLKAMNKNIDDDACLKVEQSISCIEAVEMKKKLTESLKEAMNIEAHTDFYSTAADSTLEIKNRSKEIPCASDAVEIRYDETFRRHLVVNRYVPPGEILLIEEFYATFPSRQERYLICANCLDFTLNGIPCDHCSSVIFCSKSCKEQAWKKYHRIECEILKNLMDCNEGVINEEFFLRLRSVLIGLGEKGSDKSDIYVDKTSDKRTKGFIDGQFLSNKFKCLCSLEDHENELNSTFSTAIEDTSFNMSMILDQDLSPSDYGTWTKSDLMKMIKKIIRIVNINAFSCEENDDRLVPQLLDMWKLGTDNTLGVMTRGSGLAICSSLINHNCSPNTGRIFKNGKIIIFSSRPIQENEQIFTTYTQFGLDAGKHRRQALLRTNFFFDCNCFSCRKDLFVKFDRQKFLELKHSFQDYLIMEALEKFKMKDVKKDDKSYSMEQYLYTFLKSKITKIHETKSQLDRIREDWMHKQMIVELFARMHCWKLSMKKCCE